MLYAKVAVGLAVPGPFDYIVPQEMRQVKAGCRVKVNFRNRKIIGYVVGLSRRTKISNLKSLTSLIDNFPLLDKNTLLLTKKLSDYYACSWGEAIESSLPEGIRKGRPLPQEKQSRPAGQKVDYQVTLLHAPDRQARWDIYIEQIRECLGRDKSAILILPDTGALITAQERMKGKIDCPVVVSYRNQPGEIEEWQRIRSGQANPVIGTRSAIFSPLGNLGLIIVEEEQAASYKQDQVPHYQLRDVAFMRASIEGVKLILGSSSPSLESFYLARQNKIKYNFIPSKRIFPEIKVLDMKNLPLLNKKRGIMLTKYLEDNIAAALNDKGKIFVFLNRRGFATYAYCHSCGMILQCSRCNVNLVYHFQDKMLRCHRCNFKMPLPNLCPVCNAGYIKYSGLGTEKLESELARLFPQARIKRIESGLKEGLFAEADIFIATESIIGKMAYDFDLSAILGIDSSLNRADFRAGEKVFHLFTGILGLSRKKIIVQTNMPKHHCLKSLENNDANIFYEKELIERKQLNFPPYKHLCLIKLRAREELKVKETCEALFNNLVARDRNRDIKVIAHGPALPKKLRGNFIGRY